MRMLVTGGAGFIGSHVADALLADGHVVGVIDDLSTGSREFVPAQAEYFEGDIVSPAAARFVEKFAPDALVHHAAKVSVRESVEDPARDATTNVMGSVRMLEACRIAKARRVVFASTGGAMYGAATRLPTPESEAPTPLSPYGAAKLAVEGYLGYYARVHGTAACALRYANVYGPRQSPHGEAGVVAIFADKFLAGVAPTVYGDGSQTRDYVHVFDVAAAVLAVLRAETTGVFNVGTGIETSVLDLAARVHAAAKSMVSPLYGPERPGDAARSSLDASALTRATGWRPRVSMDQGIAGTVAWFAERAARRAAPSRSER